MCALLHVCVCRCVRVRSLCVCVCVCCVRVCVCVCVCVCVVCVCVCVVCVCVCGVVVVLVSFFWGRRIFFFRGWRGVEGGGGGWRGVISRGIIIKKKVKVLFVRDQICLLSLLSQAWGKSRNSLLCLSCYHIVSSLSHWLNFAAFLI